MQNTFQYLILALALFIGETSFAYTSKYKPLIFNNLESVLTKDSCELEEESGAILRSDIVSSILCDGEKLLGLPYRASGIAPWILDCSGFTSYIFSLHNIKIPRSSAAQAEFGEVVNVKDAQPGDLLIFTGRDAHSGRPGHVSMVVSNDNGNIKMIHSCNRGIRYDSYPQMKYYKERFIKCVRVKIDPTLAKV
jgi:cell wall-associated NlpC family hydrolase